MEENNLIEEHGLGPVYVNRFGEKFFFNINRNSFDKVSSQVLYESKFGDNFFKEDALNVVIGTDCGLLPRYLKNRQLPKGTRYIFIEPEEVRQALKNQEMLDELDQDRMLYISMEGWAQAIDKFRIKDYFYINAVQLFNAICTQDDYIGEYAELSWHVNELLSQLHWVNSVELGSEAFITRQIMNAADNIYPAKMLENAFRNKTVVLLAGGPSLDEALPWLRTNRHKVIVFAVSRIAGQLLQTGIEPDFVFSVDPTELSFDVSKEMLNFGEKTTFICSHHAVSTLVSQWPWTVLYLGARLPWKSGLNEANLGSQGPTVTNTALQVAYDFGFKRVILLGVDLCYTKEGFTHAKGSNEHKVGPRFNLTSLQVETNDGFMAPTGCDFIQAILNLSLQAKQLSAKGCRVINCAGAAAKVEGVEYLTLDGIELEEEVGEPAEIVAARISRGENKFQYYQKLSGELERAKFQVMAIARLTQKARRINDEMYTTEGVIEDYKDKRSLDRIEKKLKREHRDFSKLVKKFGIRNFIKLTKPFTDEEWTAEEAKQLGNVFYDAYQDGAGKLLRLINDAKDRVDARRMESADVPDYVKLAEQYRKDRGFGRARLWRKHAGALTWPAETTKIFEELESSFNSILENKNTRHLANTKIQSSLTTLKQRAALLFKHKKVEELQSLLSGLDRRGSQADELPYRYLIEGFLAELAGANDDALSAYHRIVDGGDVLLEEALIRIAAISIDTDNADMANLSLQCLSQLNPVYLPYHAELKRLNGDVFAAIDAYGAYIKQFPEDTLTQIKLASLYADQKIYDAADMMMVHILSNKPDFAAAIAFKNKLLQMKAEACEIHAG